jgi:hypothetical protein
VPSTSLFREVFIDFLGNLAAAVAIFMVTYGFYLYVTPLGLRTTKITPLRSAEISEGISYIHNDAVDYWFWGRSGSYFRINTLPKLDELARRERRHITIRIVIPDPSEDGNPLIYMNMKKALDERADPNTLSANVTATIFAAITATVNNYYLHVQIGLSRTVPVLRFDVSTSGALITRDLPSLPALQVNSGNPYLKCSRTRSRTS